MPGVTDVQLKPRPIRKVAVIGGGLMGSGIATSLLVSNISVVLKEVNPQFLQRGEKTIAGQSLYTAAAFLEKMFFSMCLSFRIVFKVKFISYLTSKSNYLCKGNLEGLVKRGSLTKDRMHKAMALLKGALDYSDFKDVDMVIEVSVHIFF